MCNSRTVLAVCMCSQCWNSLCFLLLINVEAKKHEWTNGKCEYPFSYLMVTCDSTAQYLVVGFDALCEQLNVT